MKTARPADQSKAHLPLRRRLLYPAELAGRGVMVECQGFEPRVSRTPDLQSSAVTHAARTPGVWPRAHDSNVQPPAS